MTTFHIRPQWFKNLTLYEVNVRQFTHEGTLCKFEEHLQRIKDLGFGIIWLMPVQPIGLINRKGTLGSYYSIRNYTEVDAAYGTLADFKRIVKKIHELGMFVIFDWVANHTSWDNVWTSTHPEYYSKDEHGNLMAPNPDWSDVAKLDFNCLSVYDAQIEAMKFWILEADIDGFRCDMAHLVPTDFWNKARLELNKLKPIFMLAESENLDLIEYAFDCQYSWKIHHLCNEIAHGTKSATDLREIITANFQDFPENSFPLLFTSNHDENSWSGSAVERLGCALEPLNVLIYTLIGMPLVYGGQETGLNKRLSFFEKDCFEWRWDKLIPFYQKLNALKFRNQALWTGESKLNLSFLNTSNQNEILAFNREKDNFKVLVILNLSAFNQSFKLYSYNNLGGYFDIFKNQQIEINNETQFDLKGWEYLVLEKV